MAVASQTPAFGAVENQLRTLCLREFPCGPGSWREEQPSSKLKKIRKGKLKSLKKEKAKPDPDSLEEIKIQAQKEKSETLEELVGSPFSPWHLDYSWSEQAKELREIAVKSPWLIDRNFVLNYFKTLRIVDKNVTEVDCNLLLLKNLEELTLSANFITNVNSKNLPRTLKVLELCANKISDISGLCVRPPLLLHLGLGVNKISFIGDYITGDYWPNLLSLDLSHNNLCDLMDIIRKMISLPKLRNLILQGNPLSLIPGYRGYTIDCLRRLSVLDDIHISADEKHHFKGLARRREFILDEARVTLGITYIKGLPCPEEIKNPEGQPEFPVVERTYFLQFMFPEEREGKANEGTLDVGDDLADFTTLDEDVPPTDRPDNEDEEHSELRVGSAGKSSAVTADGQPERNVLFDSRPQMKSVVPFSAERPPSSSFPQAKDSTGTEEQTGSGVEGINLDLLDDSKEQEGEDGKSAKEEEDDAVGGLKLAPINSEPNPWAEELELNWKLELTRDNLLALRDFFKQGMDFSVVEQVVLGYPAEPDTASEKGNDSKEGKDKKKDLTPKGKEKKKSAETKPAPPPKKDQGKDKKKKKEPEVELVKSAPTFTTIASFHITLEHFLEGEFDYRNIFTKGDVPPPSTIRSGIEAEDKKVEKKESKDNKKKAEKSPVKKDDKKDGKKSPRGKDDKKGGKGSKHHAEEAEEEDLPPPPLEMEVTVNLHHWVTAMDSLKEEEERNKAMQAGPRGSLKQGSKENLKHV